MKTKILFSLCIAGLLAAAAVAWAQSAKSPAAVADPRIDQLLEQNEKILKNQDEILKKLDELQNSTSILKRRTS